MATETDAAIARLLLKAEAETFLNEEADLLDARQFRRWLDLLTEDFTLWMPLVRNVRDGGATAEFSREGEEMSWIEEGTATLRQRVEQIETGIHWAEQPPSRTTHMIANLRITDMLDGQGASTQDTSAVVEIGLRCRFMLYRNRNEDEQDFFIGKRNDRLRRVDGAWRLARREVFLDQNVLLAKNLSVFF